MTPKRIALGISLIVAGLNITGCTRAGSQAEISPGASTELTSSFPDEWFFYEADRPAQLRAMEGNAAPKLATARWIGQAQDLASLRGKVVVVDFWGTWCGPCMRAIPHNVEIVKQYADEGVVLIGVHDEVIQGVVAIVIKKTDVDARHASNARANVLRKQFSPGRRFWCLHNLCIKNSAGNSRHAPKFEEKRLPSGFRFCNRLRIIVDPDDG